MTAWDESVGRIVAGQAALIALWGESARVHMALFDGGRLQHIERDCPNGRFPSLARLYPPAIRLERAVRDLYGLEPVGLPDPRPWLKHGDNPAAYSFLPVDGENLHQVPVGPVHAGIIEPGHFRFTCDGETVVRLEERLGYVHRGIEALMVGASLDRAARLVGRVSGDSTVAYAFAFARAAEQALGATLPPRAILLRALMAEMERLANHIGDVGAICNDAAFSLIHTQCAILREHVLRAAAWCFGHRLMMDCIIPGGIACDLAEGGETLLRELVTEVRTRFARVARLYESQASLQDRTVGAGMVQPDLVRLFGAGGFVGRATGRDFDARRIPGYAPYDAMSFEIPVLHEGDVNARVWIRIKEVEQSLCLMAQILERLPPGPVRMDVPMASGEGMALVEGFRGDVFVWLRIEDGHVVRCHPRDPSWFQWPLLEAAIENNIVADFPLCNKSFNCSYAGHDL